MPKVQRSSYSASEKLKILQYAKERGQRAAARNFSIDHSMISRWEKWKDKLKTANGKIDALVQEENRNILKLKLT